MFSVENTVARLRLADEALSKLKFYLRLAERWKWLTAGQYKHASEWTAEIGRMLGGWIRTT